MIGRGVETDQDHAAFPTDVERAMQESHRGVWVILVLYQGGIFGGR